MPDPLNINTETPWPAGTMPNGTGGGTRDKRYQSGFRTRSDEPKGQVLPYSGIRYKGTAQRIRSWSPSDSWTFPVGYTSTTPYLGDSAWNSNLGEYGKIVRNRAYAKFKDVALGDQAQIGVFVAEAREAYGMVANRAIGLYRSYKALRKGDFRGFLRNLRVDPKRKHRNLIRSAASEASGLWLEYWFGWSPSISDMFTAVEVLNSDLKQVRYFGSSGIRLPTAQTGVIGPSASNNRSQITVEDAVLVAKTGATLKITNPDLLLASRMGLINPLAIAWELVPFSFVVDWFTKFGDVLEAKTDFLGISLLDSYNTRYLKAKSTFVTWDKRAGPYGSGYNGQFVYGVHRMQRAKGLITPVTLYPKLVNFGQSRTRAATAVSLLTQIFLAK